VISELTSDFVKCFRKLPENIKDLARKNYKLWKQDSNHPGLNFKKIHSSENIYSIRIGIKWRALGVLKDKNTIIWFWIGSHNDYDSMIKNI
jgi:hypothetical protein